MYNFLNFSDDEIISIFDYFRKYRKGENLTRRDFILHACKTLRVPQKRYYNYFSSVYDKFTNENY